MSIGYVLYTHTLFIYKARVSVYTYSAWASGVARSTVMGDARALSSGMSNEVQTLTLFRTYGNLKLVSLPFCRRAAGHILINDGLHHLI